MCKTEAPGGGKGSKSQKIDYAAVKEYWNRNLVNKEPDDGCKLEQSPG